MKFSILILTALFPLFTLAGGGGGLRPTMRMVSQDLNVSRAASAEAVYYMGHNSQTVRFAYGQWNGKSWKVETVQLKSSYPLNEKIESALSESSALSSWVKIK